MKISRMPHPVHPIHHQSAHAISEPVYLPVTPIHPLVVAEPGQPLPFMNNKFSHPPHHEFIGFNHRDAVIRPIGEKFRFKKAKAPTISSSTVNVRKDNDKNSTPSKFKERKNSVHPTSVKDKIDQAKGLTKWSEKIKFKKKPLDQTAKNNKNVPSITPIEPSHGAPKMPIEITSYTMHSPDGQVTAVTEMLYDLSTREPATPPLIGAISRPPFNGAFIPPSTDVLISSTVDPRELTTPFTPVFHGAGEKSVRASAPFDPPTTSSIYFDNVNSMNSMKPITTWSTQRHIPTPPTPFKITTPPSPSFPSSIATKRYRKKLNTPKPSESSNGLKESDTGLSAAAIAGIVIGSLVSVALLAGLCHFCIAVNFCKIKLNLVT